MPAITVIKLRRGTAAEWTAANPVLAAGEEGHETNTGQRKVGNGSTAWNSLAYFASVDPAAVVLKSIVDAKGDLVAATAADTVARLAVGANGLVLTADSAAATGMAWAAAAGGMPVTGTQTTTTRKNVFELQPSTGGVGSFSAGSVGTAFSGTTDYVFDLGYNARKGVAAEPSFTDTVEHDFNEGGFHWLEAYKEYFGAKATSGTVTTKALTSNVATITTAAAHGLVTGDGVKVNIGDIVFDGNWTVASAPTSTTFTYARTSANVSSTAASGSISFVSYRPQFFGIGRVNGELIRTQYLAGSAGFSIRDWATNGEFANISTTGAQFNTEEFVLRGTAAALPQFRFEVGATEYFTIQAAATYQTNLLIGANVAAKFQYGGSQGASFSVGGDGFGIAAGYFKAHSGGSGARNALVCEGTSGNPYDAFQGRDTAGVRRVQINPDGYLGLETNSAPADGAINVSEVMFWFDNTPGATKLKFKGKDSGGTVRSGEMAMT